MSNLKNAMLGRLTTGRPRFNRLDKRLTKEAQERHDTSSDAMNVTKHLISKEVFDPWDKALSRLRAQFYLLTSPWDDSGYRVITVDNFMKFQEAWAGYEPQLMKFKAGFIEQYKGIRERQRQRLRSVFRVEDFPPVEKVRERFTLGFDVVKIPERGTLVSLSKEQEEKIIERTKDRLRDAQADNWERLIEHVGHLAATAADEVKTKNCKGTTLENVRLLAEVLPDLNILDDPDLEEAAEKIRKMVNQITMDQIKESSILRERVSKQAREIVDLANNRGGDNITTTEDEDFSDILEGVA